MQLLLLLLEMITTPIDESIDNLNTFL